MEQAIGVIMNEDGTAADVGLMTPARRETKSAKRQKRRKHTGLYVGMVLSLFLTVGCGVAAMLLFLNVANS